MAGDDTVVRRRGRRRLHAVLNDWDHQEPVELLIGEASFRVRYHAIGMDAGLDADVRGEDEPVLDRYLLQFWPAPPASDTAQLFE